MILNRSLLPLLAVFSLASLLVLGVTGCTDSSTAAPTQTVQAGCGSCTYAIEGVKSCELAVKVDGKAYLVSGASVDAHEAGLCIAEKQAEVSGKVEGDKFVATSFKLK